MAGEVKSLAQQTAKATGDIGAQIRDIQQAVEQTVTAIAAVSSSVTTMSDANRQLTGILDHQAVEIDRISIPTAPFFAATVAILGLGIGTSAAMFTVFRAVLVRQLPVVDQDRIGLGITVFVSIETDDHSQDWLDRFAACVTKKMVTYALGRGLTAPCDDAAIATLAGQLAADGYKLRNHVVRIVQSDLFRMPRARMGVSP